MHTNPYFRQLALWHRALGNERRLFMLQLLLRRGPMAVKAFSPILRIRQTAVTRHLHILLRAGLVKSRRRGRDVFFSIADSAETKKVLRRAQRS